MKQQNKLEKEISKEEDNRIMQRLKKLSNRKKVIYLRGYADAMVYLSDNYDLKLKKIKRRFYSIKEGEFFELK